MTDLEDALPPLDELKRLRLKCEECDTTLIDSKKNPLSTSKPIVVSILEAKALQHEEKTDHLNLEVIADKRPEPVREIDCTVTVNG